MNISVLMSVYYKETPEHLNRAMHSIWDEQTIKPNEIILVQDGFLTDELYNAISYWKKTIGEVFKTIRLEKNVGLGDALNIGLKACTFGLVARMDTDDICSPDRFEKQLNIFKNSDVDICSSWVSEFDVDETKIVSYRRLPEKHDDIVKFAKKRSPINHPAVMYKKSSVQDAGGYKKMMWLEDYYLWVRMIMNGSKFYNIQEPLVNMRAGYGQLERRSGFKYFLSEVKLQKVFLKLGFVNYFEFIRNVSIRIVARIVPKKLVKIIYKTLRDK